MIYSDVLILVQILGYEIVQIEYFLHKVFTIHFCNLRGYQILVQKVIERDLSRDVNSIFTGSKMH